MIGLAMITEFLVIPPKINSTGLLSGNRLPNVPAVQQWRVNPAGALDHHLSGNQKDIYSSRCILVIALPVFWGLGQCLKAMRRG